MKLVRFECEDCNREFVMTEADAVDEDAMSCPVDACQGTVVNVDTADDEDDDDTNDDQNEDARSSGRARRGR